MKIYTRTGDDGTTGLFGGDRVAKDDARLDAYGTVDEVCATLGWAAAAADEGLQAMLRAAQETLFVIGSHLATPAGSAARQSLPALDASGIQTLENEIDAAEANLPKLTTFILPGGTELASRLHVARTVCRRAERCVVTLSRAEPVEATLITYLNRLSDWLFVQARAANALANVPDVPWRPVRN